MMTWPADNRFICILYQAGFWLIKSQLTAAWSELCGHNSRVTTLGLLRQRTEHGNEMPKIQSRLVVVRYNLCLRSRLHTIAFLFPQHQCRLGLFVQSLHGLLHV